MNIKKIKYYIKFHNSPRSRILPQHYNLELIDFVFNITLFSSIGLLPYKLIKGRKNSLPTKSKIMIEYGGNIFCRCQTGPNKCRKQAEVSGFGKRVIP